MKNFILLLFIIYTNSALALPLPQIATAAMGFGDLLLIILALLAVYLPFTKGLNIKKIIFFLCLIVSVFINLYLLNPYHNINQNKEDIPGMLWTEEERTNDKHSITEEDAFNLLKSKNSNYIFADVRTKSEKELGTATNFLQINWVDLANQYENNYKKKTVVVTCWTGMRG